MFNKQIKEVVVTLKREGQVAEGRAAKPCAIGNNVHVPASIDAAARQAAQKFFKYPLNFRTVEAFSGACRIQKSPLTSITESVLCWIGYLDADGRLIESPTQKPRPEWA